MIDEAAARQQLITILDSLLAAAREREGWDRSQGPKPYDHPARQGDDPGPGEFCKDCGDAITWQGPGPYDWLHVEEQDWRPLT